MPASPRGYHTLSEYRDCPRKFFLHRVCGLEPQNESPSLIVGRLIHEAQEGVFNEWKDSGDVDVPGSLERLEQRISGFKDMFYEEADFEKARFETYHGFRRWCETMLPGDMKTLVPIRAEWPLKVALSDGYELTGRLDRVYWDKEGEELLIMDTKTTRWSVDAVVRAFEYDDQATLYEALLRNVPEIDVVGFGKVVPCEVTIAVMPDVLNLKTKPPSCARPLSVRKSGQDWHAFEEGARGTLHDIRHKLSSYYEDPEAPFFYFPCHASTCAKFGCGYGELCVVEDINPGTPALPGFIKVDPNCEIFFERTVDIESANQYDDRGDVDV